MQAKVQPQVFQWIMDSAGWKIDELGDATNINPRLIKQWRERESEIDLVYISTISKKLRRPLSAFLLPEPPVEPPIAGFRLALDSPDVRPSRKMYAAIDLARELQNNAAELLDTNPHGERSMMARAKSNISDNPEEVAATESIGLGLVSESKRTGAERLVAVRGGPIMSVYNKLRNAVESNGMFVAQASFPLKDARGFAIAGYGRPAVILINTKDTPRSRMFTLFHEYAHVLLDGGSLCHPDPESLDTSPHGSGANIEKWCDDFASSILMPRIEFLEAFQNARKNGAIDSVAPSLSRRFRMSKRAVLARAISLLDGTDKEKCLDHYSKIKPQSPAAEGRRPSPEIACIRRLGSKYVKMVVDMENAGHITEPDMSMYLDLKTKYFDKLRELV